MTMDSTLEFEKRRNVPIKYDRNLIATTVSAMSRIQEIKTRRERAFFKNRMLASKPVSIRTDALEVLSGSHLLGRDKDSPLVQKARLAAEIKARKKEKRRAARLEEQVNEMQQDLEMEEAAEETERDVDMDTAREKIKIKVPATKKRVTSSSQKRSALMPAGDNGMSMGMGMSMD